MDRTEFLRLIEELDEKYVQQNLPLHVRPFAAFNDMSGNYEGPIMVGYGINPRDFPEYVGPNLINKTNNWYRERYGNKINMPVTFGRIPFLVRGQVFTARIPLGYGLPKVDLFKLIDGMTDGMKQSLTRKEIKDFAEHWVMGYELIYEMVDMLGSSNLSRCTSDAEELIRSAIEDRDVAVDSLQGSYPPTNVSCFHSQQHAEKMMKTVLIKKAGATLPDLQKIGHRINKLLAECLKVSSDFTNVQEDAALLANIPMDIRYQIPAVDSSAAVKSYFSAIRIGGLCATQISGHGRRLGTTPLSISGGGLEV